MKKSRITSGGQKNKAGENLQSISVADRGSAGIRTDPTNEKWATLAVCFTLVAIIWFVFGQTLRFGFVNYDDNEYVYDNPHITSGLSVGAFRWAFTHTQTANWHPLTTLSHMLDCQLYGVHPWGHHLDNVLLHCMVAILLFLAIRRLTHAIWPSAFVAALFAIHPLRVESVAWISERKDVLSGVFFMLTLLAYARSVEVPQSKSRYWTVSIVFALGLMCKPTLVTLPFVLLLFDWWPLTRIETESGWNRLWTSSRPLILEKSPLFVLSAGSCFATLLAQKAALDRVVPVSLTWRVANGAVAYASYLLQMVWPVGMAVLYPHPRDLLPLWQVNLAILFLVAFSTLAWVSRRKYPWVAVGWLWYLGMLVPMIGVFQVGNQARADRYTYLPQIGLYIIAAWSAVAASARLRLPRWVPCVLSASVIVSLAVAARLQTSYWHDSESLWTHALACTERNFIAWNNLGIDLQQKGQRNEAIECFQKALNIEPYYADAYTNLGGVLLGQGKSDQAIAYFQRALQLRPANPKAQNNLGLALFDEGRLDEAIGDFQRAIEINPLYVEANYNIGVAFQRKGEWDAAIACFQKVLRIKPDYAEAENNLGFAVQQKGEMDEAISLYEKAVKAKPDYALAYVNLGVLLERKGESDEAIADFHKALQINPDYPDAYYNLGNALQQKGLFGQAIENYQKALATNPDFAEAAGNLAELLASCPDTQMRNGARAEELAQRANRLTGGKNPVVFDILAAAYAEEGRFSEAQETVQKAVQLAEVQGNAALRDRLQQHLKLYQAGKPLRGN
jgi:Tfp pilus assembly protein PilF